MRTEFIKGLAGGSAMGLNTLVCGSVVFVASLGKFLAPGSSARNRVRRFLAKVAEAWIGINNWILGRYRHPTWEQSVPQGIDPEGTYVINCNHQSWVDILVLQKAFNRRAPFMRFFIKEELRWVPILGYAWWALDFPFMKRYSASRVSRDPSLRNRDLETARAVCRRLKDLPVSMMNFLEGTRFSPEKRKAQNSPYRHLLKPKVGGLGEVLYGFGDQLRSLIDVTIVYPGGVPGVWDLVCGRVSRIVVTAREVTIPDRLRGGDFRSDPVVRAELKAWAARLWEQKDREIEAILARTSHG